MSANNDEAIDIVDTVCPHGADSHHGPALQYVCDSGLWVDGKGMLFDPDRADEGQWIRADEDAFVEVGSQ